jgi:hypothetical protein
MINAVRLLILLLATAAGLSASDKGDEERVTELLKLPDNRTRSGKRRSGFRGRP